MSGVRRIASADRGLLNLRSIPTARIPRNAQISRFSRHLRKGRCGRLAVVSFFIPDITPSAPTAELKLSMQKAALQIACRFSIPEICLRAFFDITITIAAAWLSLRFIRWMSAKAAKMAQTCAVEEELREREMDRGLPGARRPPARGSGTVLLNTAIAALRGPSERVLPLVTITFALRTILQALQIVAEHDTMHKPKYNFARHACSRCTELLSYVEDTIFSASQLLTLLFVVWFLLAWNQRLMEVVIEAKRNVKAYQAKTPWREEIPSPICPSPAVQPAPTRVPCFGAVLLR
eukprot:jgi/Botrbrau1/3907/Bobra.0183s0128.1